MSKQKLYNVEDLQDMFNKTVNRAWDKLRIELTYDHRRISNLFEQVAYDIQNHYPNIDGHSGVKWAGHICSAIHDEKPVKFKNKKHPKNTPDMIHRINSLIGIFLVSHMIDNAYREQVKTAYGDKTPQRLLDFRDSVGSILRSSLIYSGYSHMSKQNSINPVVLSLAFEFYLEGRYPKAVLNHGESW